MASSVWTRRHPVGYGLEKSLEAIRGQASPAPISQPPSTVEELRQLGESFTLASFTIEDAMELGHLLYARLHPYAAANGTPCTISIALANSSQVLFQAAVGPGTLPDQETWIQRKRNSVLRWGASTWFLRAKQNGDAAKLDEFLAKHTDQPGLYALHGGGVPIRVKGVEGVVAVVVVSGLKQHEDHGVIVEVITQNWESS
ncbi:hypothetical protein GQ53DRAFT_748153 [Thozetella sp. PMI_491]|nr:hypothetical protein GQ53DRAFT_748153 [Thozetella sp. PMI_491]